MAPASLSVSTQHVGLLLRLHPAFALYNLYVQYVSIHWMDNVLQREPMHCTASSVKRDLGVPLVPGSLLEVWDRGRQAGGRGRGERRVAPASLPVSTQLFIACRRGGRGTTSSSTLTCLICIYMGRLCTFCGQARGSRVEPTYRP